MRDLRTERFKRANPDVPLDGYPPKRPRLKTRPRSNTDKPRVGILITCLHLGGVARVLCDTFTNVSKIELAGVAVKNIHNSFQPFLDVFAGLGCPVRGTEWRRDCQEVIDLSDVVVVWGFANPEFYAALKFRGIPVITQIHNTPQDDWTRLILEVAQKSRVCNYYQACSLAAAESAPQEIRGKVKVIINGIDPERLAPSNTREEQRALWGITEDRIVIAYMGRLANYKHPEAVAIAAKELGEPYIGLIAGDGPNWKEIRNKCEGLPVRFAKPLKWIANGFNAIDCFVNTSDYEGASMSLIEAMVCGKPIVTTETGSVPELENDAGCELFYKVPFNYSPQELAVAVKWAIRDEFRIAAARDYAMSRLTAKIMAQQFEDWILEISPSVEPIPFPNSRSKFSYFIAFSERSGSQYLCSLLRSTGLLGNPHEMFHVTGQSREFDTTLDEPGPDRITNLVLGIGPTDWKGFYRSVYLNQATENGISGTKVSWRQWESLCKNLGERPKVDKWIWLRRSNKLKQAISSYRCEHTGQFEIVDGQTVPKKPPEFDREEILRRQERLVEEERRWGEFFEREGIEPLTIWYEALCRDPGGTVQQIAESMGVTLEYEPTSRNRRQADSLSDEWYYALRSPEEPFAELPSYPVVSPKAELARVVPTSVKVQLHRAEQLQLFSLVWALQPERVLEIGFLQGGSAGIILEALAEIRKQTTLKPSLLSIESGAAEGAFTEVPEHLKQFDNFELLVGKSADPETIRQVASRHSEWDLIFIDGAHKKALDDIDAYWSLLKPRGHIVFHDACHVDVRAAIERTVRNRRASYVQTGQNESWVESLPWQGMHGGLGILQKEPLGTP